MDIEYFDPWTKFDPEDKTRKPAWGDPSTWSECPICKGHTKCIVSISNIRGNKHVQKKSCLNCGGMMPLGWVRTHCVHEWKNVESDNNYTDRYKCCKCGKVQTLSNGK